MSKTTTPDEILNFWFSERVKSLWFKKSDEFDREIKQRFINIYQLAQTGALTSWRDRSNDLLALIIIFDQFSRNMFRHTAQAFATDAQALDLTKYALSNKYPQDLAAEQQAFLYMPLMHSENKLDQALSVKLVQALGKEDNRKFALKHQEMSNRFGRFPHRNQILGRESTTDEREFLNQPGSSF